MWAMEIRNIWRPDPVAVERAREDLTSAKWEKILIRNPVVVVGTLFLAGLICKRLVGF